VKQLVKRWLSSASPRLATAVLSARARAHSQRVIAGWGCGPLNRKLVERFGPRVQEGPFAGMALTPMTRAEQLGPYLLGVYESELDEAWEVVLRGSYPQILDVGAKFGYYAVGLARRYPDAAVVAFDTDWWARRAVREMASANGAANVDVRSYCGPDWIARNAREGAFLISDCEGYEAALFGPEAIPALRTATLVIETHDFAVPGVSGALSSAFAPTHEVRVFGEDGSRRPSTLPLDFLDERERSLAEHEVRDRQLWLLCLPKAGPNQGLRERSGAASTRPGGA
jgi:hypothetical protein